MDQEWQDRINDLDCNIMDLKQELAKAQDQVAQQRDQNKYLHSQINSMKKCLEGILDLARSELTAL